MDDCIFCKIISGEIPSHVVYEDDATFCIMDIQPLTRGHLLVMPKKHVERFGDMEERDVIPVMLTVHRMVGAMSSVFQPDGYNIFQNNGRAAGQIVDHLHVHLVPRRKGDGAIAQKAKPAADSEELSLMASDLRRALED